MGVGGSGWGGYGGPVQDEGSGGPLTGRNHLDRRMGYRAMQNRRDGNDFHRERPRNGRYLGPPYAI